MEDMIMNSKQELVKTQEQAKARLNAMPFASFINQGAIQNRIAKTIGSERGQRFITAIVSAVNNNSSLAECTNDSIYSGALLGESLNLSPSPQLGHYYLVPFKDKEKGKVAQFQLGYKGYLQLAIRSGYYKKINVLDIKEGELIKYNPLDEEIEVNLIDNEEKREKTTTIGYYAMFEYTNGFKKTLYWSKNKMVEHAKKYSPGYRADLNKGTSYTFWSKDFDGMAFKTMLRQLISKWGIMSIEMQNAVEKDMGVINEDGTIDYVDNKQQYDEQEEIIEQNDENIQEAEIKGNSNIKQVDISEL
jgi:recombination protein RecT